MKAETKKAITDTFLRFDPEKIVLFGSHARDDSDAYSDVDLIVVYPTRKRFMDRLEELCLAWNLPMAVDILAYTPEEFRSMSRKNAFVQDAVAEVEISQ
jgi:predicted nucleotidyltransferase